MKKTKLEKKIYLQKIHKESTERNRKRRKNFLKFKGKRVKIVPIKTVKKKNLETKVIQPEIIQPEIIDMVPIPEEILEEEPEQEEKKNLSTKVKTYAEKLLRLLRKIN